MSSNEMPEDVKNVIETFRDMLKASCEQLEGELPDGRHDSDFDSDTFWKNLVASVKLVSHESTKICMAFESAGIGSQECQCLISKLEKACLALLSVFFKLPISRGKCFQREIQLYVLSILQGVKNLCTAIINQSGQLQNVGDVWAHCEAVESLPKDNRDAVIKLCQEQHDMVYDASQELMSAIEEGEPNNDLDILDTEVSDNPTWNEADRNVLFPCSGLLKASKAIIKKVISAIKGRAGGNSQTSIDELDTLADIVRSSSSTADDFVLTIYAPMNHSSVRQQAMLMRNNSKELLFYVKNSHFYIEADDVWIEFLGKAVDHNWVRINDMVLAD